MLHQNMAVVPAYKAIGTVGMSIQPLSRLLTAPLVYCNPIPQRHPTQLQPRSCSARPSTVDEVNETLEQLMGALPMAQSVRVA